MLLFFCTSLSKCLKAQQQIAAQQVSGEVISVEIKLFQWLSIQLISFSTFVAFHYILNWSSFKIAVHLRSTPVKTTQTLLQKGRSDTLQIFREPGTHDLLSCCPYPYQDMSFESNICTVTLVFTCCNPLDSVPSSKPLFEPILDSSAMLNLLTHTLTLLPKIRPCLSMGWGCPMWALHF